MGIDLEIPDWKRLHLESVLFDMNGTLSSAGVVAPETRRRLADLAAQFQVVVMSADTFGTLEREMAGLPVMIRRTEPGAGAPQKLAFLETLGADSTVAVGNGRNDVLMLEASALGIAILGPEGLAREALLAADLVFASIDDALDCLLDPRRLVASLRG